MNIPFDVGEALDSVKVHWQILVDIHIPCRAIRKSKNGRTESLTKLLISGNLLSSSEKSFLPAVWLQLLFFAQHLGVGDVGQDIYEMMSLKVLFEAEKEEDYQTLAEPRVQCDSLRIDLILHRRVAQVVSKAT